MRRDLRTATLLLIALLSAVSAFDIRAQSRQIDYAAAAGSESISIRVENPSGFVRDNIRGSGAEARVLGLTEFGTLKSSSYAAAVPVSRGDASLTAGFRDDLTFTNDLLAGRPGFVEIDIFYLWGLSLIPVGFPTAGAASAGASVALNISSGFAFARETWTYNPNTPIEVIRTEQSGGGVELLGEMSVPGFSVRVPIIFGTPTYMELLLTTVASATGIFEIGPAAASADASQSAYWAGITGVFDLGLLPVEYEVTSLSGTDYRMSFVPTDPTPIPEPSTLLLLLAALAAPIVSIRRTAAKSRE